jgi:hypothetical protein
VPKELLTEQSPSFLGALATLESHSTRDMARMRLGAVPLALFVFFLTFCNAGASPEIHYKPKRAQMPVLSTLDLEWQNEVLFSLYICPKLVN